MFVEKTTEHPYPTDPDRYGYGGGPTEALARFVQTDPKEIADAHDKARRDEEEVDRYVTERERSIRAGARRAGKRFRL